MDEYKLVDQRYKCTSVHLQEYYRSINGLSKECFGDEVNENKTENPVDVDKASSEASEEGTHGPSKMFAIVAWLIRTFFL